MWLYRRMVRVPRVDRVTNRAVMEKIKKDLEVINIFKGRKLEYLGHIMRNKSKCQILKSKVVQRKVFVWQKTTRK